jgi:hypothetical protein
LAASRVARLEALPGWSWDPQDDQWEDQFARLEAFVTREGHARVPGDHVEDDSQRLGEWVMTQRGSRRRNQLSPSRVARLEALPGWLWDVRDATWEENFAVLEAFAAREGHARLPSSGLEDGQKLGRWVTKQRASHGGRSMSAKRVARLEALPGWSWDPQDDQWEENFAALEAFAAREGHARVPVSHVAGNQRLGEWVKNQRASHRRGELSAARGERLDAVPGWTWEARDAEWEENFAALESFVAREGHARVPAKHVENGHPLGRWVSNQRGMRRRISPSRVARLDRVPGWTWDVLDAIWEENFAVLQGFIAREGHARVPATHIEDGVKLGVWVVGQRNRYARGRLPPEQVERLSAQPEWAWRMRTRRT